MLFTMMFYLFAGMLVISALGVITVRRTIYGVFFLILAFLNAAGLFILANAEFLAMILVIVYVGAVAVLFLFVVMMLGEEILSQEKISRSYLGAGLGFGFLLWGELVFCLKDWYSLPKAFHQDIFTTQSLGQVLYTTYFLPFQMAGLILLVAMIGATILTLRVRKDVRRQNPAQQSQQKSRVTLVDAPLGKGLTG